MKTLPKSKAEAIARGEKYYTTGIPCAKGHTGKRLVSNSKCCACDALHVKMWQKENPGALSESKKKWREANREHTTAYRLEWRNRNLKKDIANTRKWQQNNRGAMAEIWAKRRAERLKARPAWADRNAIREVYKRARAEGKQVDHIIPLKGKLVCGLHVHNNLQLMDAGLNAVKFNRFDPETFDPDYFPVLEDISHSSGGPGKPVCQAGAIP